MSVADVVAEMLVNGDEIVLVKNAFVENRTKLIDKITFGVLKDFGTERAMEEFWAYEFLSLRNVRPAVVQSMQDVKIDCEAVVVMTDDHLKRYLPAYGDRVALMAFAGVTSRNQNLNPATSATPPRREGAGPLHGRHMLGNKRAVRVSGRVELGWFTNIESPSYTSKSKFGRPTEFSMSIRDFKGDMLEQHLTVEDVYQHQHTKTLHLSLYTSHKAFTPEGECSKCKQAEERWSRFIEEVDNVVPLAQKCEPRVQEVTVSESTAFQNTPKVVGKGVCEGVAGTGGGFPVPAEMFLPQHRAA
ncbi:hypothetical protein DPMN_109631 [Dreissena polymorpha]|uniref:Uncharacterized protein n=1 Tax=Dreissena polymorpha TaxID=45954 RepID=A0A9D4KBH2_DREPO|nr:hypothetical protein DPMN_109631 [Dreissena polymorpha]